MRYSLQSTERLSRLQILATPPELDQVDKNDPRFSSSIQSAQHLGSLAIDKGSSLSTLTFQFDRVLTKRTPERQRAAYTNAYMAFAAISNHFFNHNDGDPQLHIRLSPQRLADATRLNMDARLEWPSHEPETSLAQYASSHMRNMARHVGYPWRLASASDINDMVGVASDRDNGVSLVVNPLGSCSLDTDGSDYSPDDSQFEVHAHNLYSTEMQLICAIGAVAFAHYDDLV